MTYGTVNVDAVTTSDGTTSSGLYGFKNRIINGAMVIDQRNAGAQITPGQGQYSLDRWCFETTQANKFTTQQNAGNVTRPNGFQNYLGITIGGSAYSPVSTDYMSVLQVIEGYNLGDLNWGTANAASITLSFRVYSSLTGTFGGAIVNYAQTRSYPFNYTVSSANTWTTVSITIPGDTTGTWVQNSNAGSMFVFFNIGCGSNFSGAANTWASAGYHNATGSVSIVATANATFYITGVQLEKGSTATSFDYRPYGTELALCQRYFETSFEVGTAVAEAQVAPEMISSVFSGTTDARSQYVFFSTKKRATPTITLYRGLDSSTAGKWAVYSGAWNTLTTNNGSGVSVNGFFVALNKTSLGTTYYSYLTQGNWTASSEL
jgi:hypothetical protein